MVAHSNCCQQEEGRMKRLHMRIQADPDESDDEVALGS